jgi:glyoxylase I family protein
MVNLKAVHHIAIICSNYPLSKKFYTEVLGFTVEAEYYRAERNSYKLDLKLGDRYCIELFSFPNPPARVSRPEACGLRHLAFEVSDLDNAILWLKKNGVETEPVRKDEYTGKRFTFFPDPDNLPLELYEL